MKRENIKTPDQIKEGAEDRIGFASRIRYNDLETDYRAFCLDIYAFRDQYLNKLSFIIPATELPLPFIQ